MSFYFCHFTYKRNWKLRFLTKQYCQAPFTNLICLNFLKFIKIRFHKRFLHVSMLLLHRKLFSAPSYIFVWYTKTHNLRWIFSHDHRKRLESGMQDGIVLEPTPEDCKALMNGAALLPYSLTAVGTLVVVSLALAAILVTWALSTNERKSLRLNIFIKEIWRHVIVLFYLCFIIYCYFPNIFNKASYKCVILWFLNPKAVEIQICSKHMDDSWKHTLSFRDVAGNECGQDNYMQYTNDRQKFVQLLVVIFMEWNNEMDKV